MWVCANTRSKVSAAPKNNGPSIVYTSTPGGSWIWPLARSSLANSSSTTCCTSTEDAMRRMNCSMARMTPMFTAITRSLNTVRPKVMSRIATSARGARCTMRLKCFSSLML
ncbi:hypothetical protein D9M71_746710 [compost metagenome]